MTENELNEFERRSKNAIKGWITRRAKQKAKKATEKALKGWDTRRENQAKEKARAEKASTSAKKGWETRRENQAKETAEPQTTKTKKQSKKKKNNFWLNIAVSILAFIIGAVGAIAVYCHIHKPENDVYVSGNLSIHFLELGNKYTGDSTYIKAGDVDILIDAGSKYNSASTIANYIDDYVTDGKLEYVIATHAHEDHIAGFCNTSGNGGGIFNRFDTGIIIDFPKTTKTNFGSNTIIGKYQMARDAEVEKGATHYTALECYNNQSGAQRVYELTPNIKLEILYNYFYDHTTSDENDYSVCVMIHHGDEKHFLFTGDLEHEGEEKMVEYYNANHGGLPKCELYKGGHHGSKTSSTVALMNAIQPKIVCVCCCAGTSEYTDASDTQFPTQAFIDRIAPYTQDVYVTSMVDNYVVKDDWDTLGTVKSMNGNIVVTSTRQGTTVVGSNNSTKLKDTDWFKNNRTMPSAWGE